MNYKITRTRTDGKQEVETIGDNTWDYPKNNIGLSLFAALLALDEEMIESFTVTRIH